MVALTGRVREPLKLGFTKRVRLLLHCPLTRLSLWDSFGKSSKELFTFHFILGFRPIIAMGQFVWIKIVFWNECVYWGDVLRKVNALVRWSWKVGFSWKYVSPLITQLSIVTAETEGPRPYDLTWANLKKRWQNMMKVLLSSRYSRWDTASGLMAVNSSYVRAYRINLNVLCVANLSLGDKSCYRRVLKNAKSKCTKFRF